MSSSLLSRLSFLTLLGSSLSLPALAPVAFAAPGEAVEEDIEIEISLDDLDEYESEGLIEAPQVVITGTRRESALKDAPVAVEVLSQEQIKTSRARSAADALQSSQGLVITPTVFGSGIEMQGLDARHVLVLIDGERVSGKTAESFDFSKFPAESIERIEIVKGASSALYGSDAIAGVINIITRDGRGRTQASFDLVYGGFNRTELALQGSGQLSDDVSLSLGVAYRHDDGFSLRDNIPGTSGNAYDDITSHLRLRAKLAKWVELDARVQHLYREQQALDATAIPDDFEGNPRFRLVDRSDTSHDVQMRLAPTFTFGDHSLRLSLSGSITHSHLIFDQRGGTLYDTEELTKESLFSPSLQWNYEVGRNQITAGIEYYREHLEADRLDEGVAIRDRFAAYAQDEISLLRDSNPHDDEFEAALTLIPGIRVDHDSQFGTAVAPRLALRYDPWEALTLRGSYGLGFRAPGFRELYLLFQNPAVGYRVEGNPDLKPEQSRSGELSFEFRPVDHLTFHLNLFRHDLDNLIIIRPANHSAGELDLYTYYNVEQATSMGLEFRGIYSPSRDLRIELGYGLTDSRDDKDGQRIIGRATHQVTSSLRWKLPWDFEFFGRFTLLGPRPFEEQMFGLSFGGVNTSDITGITGDRFESGWEPLLDLRLSRDFNENLSLFVALDNVLNAVDPITLPHRPRTFFAGLTGTY